MIQNSIIQKLCNIKVAVRVRSLNEKEKVAESNLCIQKYYEGLQIVNSEKKTEIFFCDYCIWPEDNNSEVNDQQKIFDGIGRDMLNSAWEGYNCCLVAYGQTGTGKSYSLFGTESQKGIVHRFCDALFKNIESSQITHEVWISICEIESEGLYDRLIPDQTSNTNLSIREGAFIGVYIPDLSMHLVRNYSEIEQRIALGIENQFTANCRMGRHTWRSTLIIELEFKQIIGNTHRVSKIQFFDMADLRRLNNGVRSSKQSAFKEVINQLYDGNSRYIPYRNSNLTRVLQNALGGNCQTFMICAISPSSLNYDETIATLRLASRARRIPNRVQIYQFQNNQTIDNKFQDLVSLKEEINQLVQQLHEQNQMSIDLLQQIISIREEFYDKTNEE